MTHTQFLNWRSDFKFLIDYVKGKLDGWKASFLFVHVCLHFHFAVVKLAFQIVRIIIINWISYSLHRPHFPVQFFLIFDGDFRLCKNYILGYNYNHHLDPLEHMYSVLSKVSKVPVLVSYIPSQ